MTVQKRIEEVLMKHAWRTGEGRCWCGEDVGWICHPAHVAAAVQDVLEVWLPPLFASAIHAYADSELGSLPGYGDDPTGGEALTQLNDDAASIANSALTDFNWRAV